MLVGKYKWPNTVVQNRLTLEQKELCRCRLKLLTYLDRLATYEVRSSFNQTNYVHLICHYKCWGCLHIWYSWSLELFMWEKFILYRSRFSYTSVLVKFRDSWKARSCFVSLGSRNALAISEHLCFLGLWSFSFSFILHLNFRLWHIAVYSTKFSIHWVLIILIWIFLTCLILMIY